MLVYRKIGRSLLEMNRGNHWRMWSRYVEMSTDLLNMDSYQSFWYFGCDDVVHKVLWSDGSDCRDSLVVGFRGILEIHSMIEKENEALLSSFDHYHASLMDVDNLWYDQSHTKDGSIEKTKSRFVAHGFSQKEGIDYEDTFAPMARHTSIRAIMELATKLG